MSRLYRGQDPNSGGPLTAYSSASHHEGAYTASTTGSSLLMPNGSMTMPSQAAAYEARSARANQAFDARSAQVFDGIYPAMNTAYYSEPIVMAGPASGSGVEEDHSGVSQRRRRRQPLACTPCHTKKRRCDGQLPCSNCEFADGNCFYPALGEKRQNSAPVKRTKSDLADSDPRRVQDHGRVSSRTLSNLTSSMRSNKTQHRQDNEEEKTSSRCSHTHKVKNLLQSSASSVEIDAVAISLFDLFCKDMYPLTLLLPPGALRRRLLALPRRNLLLTGICALAARLIASDQSPTTKELRKTDEVLKIAPCHLGDPFAHVTHTQLFSDEETSSVGLDRPTLELAQSMILMVLQTAAAGRWKRGWVYLGMMMRVLKELGIHDDDLVNIPSDTVHVVDHGKRIALREEEIDSAFRKDPTYGMQREERRRTFWLAFVADALANALTGRPRTMRLQDIRLYLPLDEGSFLRSDPASGVYDEAVAKNVAKGSGDFLLVRAPDRAALRRWSISKPILANYDELAGNINQGRTDGDRVDMEARSSVTINPDLPMDNLIGTYSDQDLNEHKRKAFWQAFVKDMLSSAISSRSRTLRPLDLNLFLVLGPQSLGLSANTDMSGMDIHSIEKEQGPRIKTFIGRPHIGAFGHLIRIVGFLGKVQACYFERERANAELLAASVSNGATETADNPSTARRKASVADAGSNRYAGIVETPEECWAEVIEWKSRLPAHLTRAPANRLWAKEMLEASPDTLDARAEDQLKTAERGAAWCWVFMHTLASVAMYQLLAIEEISNANDSSTERDDSSLPGGPPPEQDSSWIRRKRKQWLMDDVRAFLVLLGDRGRRSPMAIYPLYILTKHNVSKNLPPGEAISRRTCIPDQQIQQWWRELGPLWGVNALGMLGLENESQGENEPAKASSVETSPYQPATDPPSKVASIPQIAPADADALVNALASVVSQDVPSMFGEDFATMFSSNAMLDVNPVQETVSVAPNVILPSTSPATFLLEEEDSEMTRLIDDFMSKRDNASPPDAFTTSEPNASFAAPFSAYGHTQSAHQPSHIYSRDGGHFDGLAGDKISTRDLAKPSYSDSYTTPLTGQDDLQWLQAQDQYSFGPFPDGALPYNAQATGDGGLGYETKMPYDLAYLLGLIDHPKSTT